MITILQAVKSLYPHSQGLVMLYHNQQLTSNFHSVTAPSLAIIPSALPTILHDLAKNNPQMYLELFSVSKCFFFPEIDLAAGCQQQFYRMRREVANTAQFRKIREDLLVLAAFWTEYICGYLRKHAVWLPVTLLKGVTRSIRRASGEWPHREKWWYKDFKYVQLEFSGHRLEFDPDLNNIVTKQLLKTGTGGSMSIMQKLIAWSITKRWLNFLKIGKLYSLPLKWFLYFWSCTVFFGFHC